MDENSLTLAQCKKIIIFLMDQINKKDELIAELQKQSSQLTASLFDIQARNNLQSLAQTTKKGENNKIQMTFKECSDLWLEEYARKNHRGTTLYAEEILARRVVSVLGNTNISEFTSDDLQKYINKLAENGANITNGNPLSRKTIKHHLTYLHNIFNFAEFKKFISYNPCEKLYIPKIDGNGQTMQSKTIEIYSLDEAKDLLKMLAKAPFKYQIFFTLAIYTGLRRSELLGLEWKDIDFVNNRIRIQRTSNYTKIKGIYTDVTKTKKSARTVDIPPELSKLLKLYQNAQSNELKKNAEKGITIVKSDRLFVKKDGSPMNPATPYSWLKRTCQRRNFKFYGVHTFRHLNASLQISAGVDTVSVAAVLGHSTPSTTLNIYSHCFDDAAEKACNAVSAALKD